MVGQERIMSTEATLLGQGVDLMLYGMGTVFVFLTLLVLATSAMSRLIMHLQQRVPVPVPTEGVVAPAGEVDEAIVAAITAALHRHRQDVSQRR